MIELYHNNDDLATIIATKICDATNIYTVVLSMKVMPFFAARLKELRENSGLTQAELGAALGVSRGSIGYYEKQERVPDIEFLFAASSLFSVSLDYLLGLENAKTHEHADIQSKINLSEEAITGLLEATEGNGGYYDELDAAQNAKLYSLVYEYCEDVNVPRNIASQQLMDFFLSKSFFAPFSAAVIDAINAEYLIRSARVPREDSYVSAPARWRAANAIDDQIDLSLWKAQKKILELLDKMSSAFVEERTEHIEMHTEETAADALIHSDRFAVFNYLCEEYECLHPDIRRILLDSDDELADVFTGEVDNWVDAIWSGEKTEQDFVLWLEGTTVKEDDNAETKEQP